MDVSMLAAGAERYGPPEVVLVGAAPVPVPARGRFAPLLDRGGTYVTTGFSPGLAWRAGAARLLSRQRFAWLVSAADGDRMRALSRLVEQGALSPVIDSAWPLGEIRAAYRRLEAGHARGKIVLTMS
jgi:NADPH:quinone reductase-like Zn-dependent oxidoreductase